MSSSWQLVYWTSTQAFRTAFVLALTRLFRPYPRPLPPLITHLLTSILLNLIPLFRLSFRESAMWAQLPRRKWSSLLGPSRPPCSVSYLNQGNLGNSESFKIYLRHILPLIPSHPSTARLTQVCTPACGALSQLSASSYGTSPQDRRLRYAMSRKHTGAFQSSPSSGPAWSFAWTKETVSQLTHRIVLGWHQAVAFTAAWVMQGLKPCAPVALAPSPSGSTTTSSFGFCVATSTSTISREHNGLRTSQEMEESCMTEVVSGSRVQSCQMTRTKNLTKIRLVLCEISRKPQKGSFISSSAWPPPSLASC